MRRHQLRRRRRRAEKGTHEEFLRRERYAGFWRERRRAQGWRLVAAPG